MIKDAVTVRSDSIFPRPEPVAVCAIAPLPNDISANSNDNIAICAICAIRAVSEIWRSARSSVFTKRSPSRLPA